MNSITGKKVSISVVIPTINKRQQFLLETLECLYAQSRPPEEILVINNGNSPIDVDFKDGNCRALQIMRGAGVAQARNFGVCMATSEYIAFIDDDDLWEVDYLQKIERAILSSRPDCLIGRLDQLSEGKVKSYKNCEGKLLYGVLMRENPGITGSNTTVRRSSFLAVGGYDCELPPSEDKSLIIDMLHAQTFEVQTVIDAQAILRQHGGERLSNESRLHKGVKRFLEKYGKKMTLNERIFNLYKIRRTRTARFVALKYVELIILRIALKLVRDTRRS